MLPNSIPSSAITRRLYRPGRTSSSGISVKRTPRRQQQQRRNESSKCNQSDCPPPSPAAPQPTFNPSGGAVASAAGATTPPPTTATTTTSARALRSVRNVLEQSALGRLGRSYARAQDKHPYTTQVCSSIVVYLCGDLSAQLLFPTETTAKVQHDDSLGHDDRERAHSGRSYDPWRTLRHLTVGIGSSIPAYKWFMFLHHNFNYASKAQSVAIKVVVQQIVFTPVFNTYFFSAQSLLAGASLQESWERLQMALPVSIKNSLKLWPAVTAFSFLYVPPHFRSVFAGCIAVGWQTYLSWLNQKAAREVLLVAAASEQDSSSSSSLSNVTIPGTTGAAHLRPDPDSSSPSS